ncbi:MAG: glycosyltransferase [Acidimicrobiales bacterium]|uniref:glycosyltransferase n=1 Tax=Mycobacterium sp. TaxID=1785 RepID=UPI003F9D2522
MVRDAPRLTVIVPAFNESLRLAERAARLEAAVEDGTLCPLTTELIVVDDGSTDETGWRAEELLASTFTRLRVLRLHDNSGKGAAIRQGAAAATASVVIFMDADMSVDPSEIPRLAKSIGPADVAIGSRSLADSVVFDSLQRKLMGRVFNMMVGALTDMPYRDTQCGFKAFRTPVARILFHLMTVERFAFDVDVLNLAHQLKLEIAEVAVHWRAVGKSTVRTLSDPLMMTRDVLGLRRRQEWPNIPALAVNPTHGERRRSHSRIVGELHKAMGPNFPLLMVSEDQCLVLMPLCNPIEVQEVAARLRKLPTKFNVRERSVSFSELTDLTPFKWIDEEDDGFIVAPHADASNLVTHTPFGGWDSMRSIASQPVRYEQRA